MRFSEERIKFIRHGALRFSLPFKLTDVNTHIEEERKVTREVREQLGLTDRRCNAMAGELEESKALLEAAIRHVS